MATSAISNMVRNLFINVMVGATWFSWPKMYFRGGFS